ncbi:anti-sigma factor [uncultured Brevundimonas sp.]|uniref:anti-sigma factor family protein n=1 Tax=uncultured Brevundimonas sp. TaxID=213418 RepID=UPI0030EE42E0|tara:strand:+ start:3421 stop:4194 length:774 start_codon:yes stop_codon:yes gene_type:complete
MTGDRPISEDDLHAFLDGMLDPARRDAVERYLDTHPQAAARIATYRTQGDALRAALAPIADQPTPPEFALRPLVERRRRRFARHRQIAAAIGILCLGGMTGWFGHQALTLPSHGVHALAQEAVDNYEVYAADLRRPVELPSDQTAALAYWVSERLGAPVEPPDLRAAGYRFLGGRLVTTPNGPAAMFIYEGPAADRLAVMARPMTIDKNRAMSERAFGALQGVTWSRDGLGFSVVAPRASGRLAPVAAEVQRQTASA